MSTNPEIQTFGEVFIPKDYEQLGGYYKYLHGRVRKNPSLCIPTLANVSGLFGGYLNYLRRLSGDVDLILFDCKYDFLRGAMTPGAVRMEHSPLLDLLIRHDFKIIHLVRDNVLAMLVSVELSTRTKVWATPNPDKMKDRTVELPLGNLLDKLGKLRREQKHWEAVLEPIALTVHYETLFVDGEVPESTLQSFADHLDVPREFVARPAYQKIGLPLKDAIRNYDAVAKVLEGSIYERYLES